MKKLTLTFDNGPFADVTPGVLDLLATRGMSATFFVCGKDIEDPSRRAIVERAKAEGHRIGNHTFTHSIELGATDDVEAPAAEIGRAQEVLGQLSGPDRLFRPYGAGGILGPRLLSRGAVDYLCHGGFSCVLWNCVPRDWEDPEGWPERALAEMSGLEWTLMVLHDVPTGAMWQLERFLDDVATREIEVVQDYPAECVPIHRGRVSGDLEGLVRPG